METHTLISIELSIDVDKDALYIDRERQRTLNWRVW